MKNENIKIFNLCFSKKDYNFTEDSVITPLQVGADITKTDVCSVKDNTGENISNLNYFYIENTGVYWIWKNVHSKIKGQMQYRRNLKDINEKTDFDEIFKKYDVITCVPYHYPSHKVPTSSSPMYIPADTVEGGYAFSHCIDDLWIIEYIIKCKYPDYITDYEKYIKKGEYLYYSNGFVMPSDLYDKYCTFLFDCLNEYLSLARLNNYNDLINHVIYNIKAGKYIRFNPNVNIPEAAIKWQSEIGGFLSERLWTLWLLHNIPKEKIFETEYIKMEEGMFL